MNGIRQASPLHDIGKLAVSDTILLKRGALTPKQWEQMRSHTTAGHEILAGSNSNVLSLAAEIALSHHEWWDGSGYPAGLKEEQIPLSGRIVALADVFDSLCHERPYKQAWTVEQAVAEIHRLNGTQFDPAVVHAFSQLDLYQLAEYAPTDPPAARRDMPRQIAIIAKRAGAKGNEASPVRSDDRYRRLVERSNDLILTMDLGGIVTAANPATQRILGFSPEQIVGTNIMEYVAPGELERAGAIFEQIAAGGELVCEEVEHVAKDGCRVFLEMSTFPIELDGQLVGIEGIARDVIERRALQDALTCQSL
jgi:PAS domain S-box-containing protein